MHFLFDNYITYIIFLDSSIWSSRRSLLYSELSGLVIKITFPFLTNFCFILVKSKILIKPIFENYFLNSYSIIFFKKLDFLSLALKVIPVDLTFYHTNFCKYHSFKILKFNLTLAKHRVFCVSPHLTWISGTRFVLRGVVCHSPKGP